MGCGCGNTSQYTEVSGIDAIDMELAGGVVVGVAATRQFVDDQLDTVESLKDPNTKAAVKVVTGLAISAYLGEKSKFIEGAGYGMAATGVQDFIDNSSTTTTGGGTTTTPEGERLRGAQMDINYYKEKQLAAKKLAAQKQAALMAARGGTTPVVYNGATSRMPSFASM